ncbi:hypothetical protein ACFPM0_17470 [Pseudonocardia sulfidoxydans]|uniref:hypothetical protein n=1 Tax=Pseudonocardia sulfidoxydans TaxID=54011 RepID=UPI00361AE0DF
MVIVLASPTLPSVPSGFSVAAEGGATWVGGGGWRCGVRRCHRRCRTGMSWSSGSVRR